MSRRSGEIHHFEIQGATTPADRLTLEQTVAEVGGVTGVWVDGAAGRLSVRGSVAEEAVLQAVHAGGYSARRLRRRGLPSFAGGLKHRLGSAAAATLALLVVDTLAQSLGAGPGWRWVALLLAVGMALWAGRPAWRAGMAGWRVRRTGLEGLLVLGFAGSWLHAALNLGVTDAMPGVAEGGYLAFPMLGLTLYLAGRMLEQRGVGPSRRVVDSLRALLPEVAIVEAGSGGLRQVPVSALQVGQRVHVAAGERVPADGVVVSGSASVDESLLTGDPAPVAKSAGDEVVGGTINRMGHFALEVSRVGEESLLDGMIRGVRQAQRDKPVGERKVDRIAAGAVAVGGFLAAGALCGWWWGAGASGWGLFAACTVLILAASPGLALAGPLATDIGLARLTEYGAVARGAGALEAVQSLTMVVLDKTGTVTQGEPEVVAVEPVEGVAIRDLFRWAAAVEAAERAGPVARAARERGLTLVYAEDHERLPCGAARATVEGRSVLLGGAAAMEAIGIRNPLAGRGRELQDEASSPLFVAVDGRLAGVVALADAPRAEAAGAVRRLRSAGLRVIMLTGDDERTARAVAAEIGIGEVLADVLPSGKAACIRALQQQGERVAMVGDGVNDAAALVQADVGIAVAGGTDVAVQSADVTVLRDSLHAVVDAVIMARATSRNIRENAAAAFAYSAAGVPVAAGLFHAAFGWALTPGVLAVLLLLGLLTVLTNANRLRFYEVPGAEIW
ncbi:heavy metal translocating P-type ATPase [Arhodomonas sp. AD133]|uniref:heavy metal translocating P-type ATPase n=1 Tax=Arhodomonas sp. AD133 TaxID=3415009 RepID=UPI003EBC8282